MAMSSHIGRVEGQTVRVIRGPLAGVEGVLQNHNQGYRLAVAVKLLGRSVVVEIDRQDVAPV